MYLAPLVNFMAGIKDQVVGVVNQRTAFALNVTNPSWLTASGDFVYGCSEQANGSVFSMDKNGQIISRSEIFPSPVHIDIQAELGLLGVSSYDSGDIRVFQVNVKTGQIGKLLFTEKYTGVGVNPQRQEAPHAHQFVFHKDKFYIADLGLDAIHVYETKTFKRLPDIALPPGAGPRHLAFTAQDDIVCVNELLSSVSLIRDNRVLMTTSIIDYGYPARGGAAEVAIVGDNIYVSQRDVSGEAFGLIAHFKNTGYGLVKVKTYPLKGKIPRYFAEKNGQLYVPQSDQTDMTIFTIQTDGSLLLTSQVPIGLGGQVLAFI